MHRSAHDLEDPFRSWELPSPSIAQAAGGGEHRRAQAQVAVGEDPEYATVLGDGQVPYAVLLQELERSLP